MKIRALLLLLCTSLIFLLSCVTVRPSNETATVLIYVENRSKHILTQNAVLTLSEKKGTLNFNVQTPYILVATPGEGKFLTTRYETNKKRSYNPLIEFHSRVGTITIFPQKLVCYSGSTSKFEELSSEDKKEITSFIEQDKQLSSFPIRWE